VKVRKGIIIGGKVADLWLSLSRIELRSDNKKKKEETTRETILDRCRRLNIKLDLEIEKIANLQIEIQELQSQRERMFQEGEDTAAFDAALKQLRSEVNQK
jgi:FtsZ-binding cell division protein ZapB